jgi:hypothetical protein
MNDVCCCCCGERWTLFEDSLDSQGWRWCKDCTAVELGKLPRPVQRRPVGAFDDDEDPAYAAADHEYDRRTDAALEESLAERDAKEID